MDGFLIIFMWLIVSFAVGFLGNDRKIGFAGACLVSIFLSPLLGALFVLASEKVDRRTEITYEARELITEGEKRFQLKDYEGAVRCFQKVLALQPIAPNTNFRLAQIYSRTGKLEQAFKHLTLAVEQGFKDYATINAVSEFDALRKLPQFQDYVQNGYKLPTASSSKSDVISELEKLANLKKEGFLTDEEYTAQKKKLLESSPAS